jgi:hypothetical protein
MLQVKVLAAAAAALLLLLAAVQQISRKVHLLTGYLLQAKRPKTYTCICSARCPAGWRGS